MWHSGQFTTYITDIIWLIKPFFLYLGNGVWFLIGLYRAGGPHLQLFCLLHKQWMIETKMPVLVRSDSNLKVREGAKRENEEKDKWEKITKTSFTAWNWVLSLVFINLFFLLSHIYLQYKKCHLNKCHLTIFGFSVAHWHVVFWWNSFIPVDSVILHHLTVFSAACYWKKAPAVHPFF